MALADKAGRQVVSCSTCRRTLDDETAPATTCRVVVGIQDGGGDSPDRWIVRAFCPTCAESHYHTLVYGHYV